MSKKTNFITLITVISILVSSISINATGLFMAPPPNDTCANATSLNVGASFNEQAIVSTLFEATDTHGTGGYVDVWFSVEVPASGNITIETDFATGSTMNDTFMYVYSGACGSMIDIDFDDDDGHGSFSKIQLSSQTPGATLIVKVEEDADSVDPLDSFQISAYEEPIPINDTCANATSLNVGFDFADQAIITTLASATDTHGGSSVDVWFSVVVPESGTLTIETDYATGSSLDDTWMAVYSGVCGTMVTIETDDNDGNGNFSKVALTGLTPDDILIVKVEEDTDSSAPLDTFQISAYDVTLPPNDTCENAISLNVGTVFSDEVIIATLEGATNTYSGFPEDVWFSVVVPASGNLTIETDFATGSAMNDTFMRVYSGTCGALTLIQSNDNGGNGDFAKIELTGQTPGETLIVMVEDDTSSSEPLDTFQISAYDDTLTPPTNDTCANAIALTVGSEFNDEAIVATLEGATDTHGTGGYVDVWFSVVVPASGNITIETDYATGSAMNDTWMAVYSGTCGSLVSIETNDDDGNGNFSKIELTGLTPDDILIVKVEEDSDSVDPLDTFQISVYDDTLGDNDMEIVHLEIYPNPVSEVLFVKTTDRVDAISIYNMLGQEVLRSTETQIDVRNIPKATYVVKVEIGERIGSLIFIKQ